MVQPVFTNEALDIEYGGVTVVVGWNAVYQNVGCVKVLTIDSVCLVCLVC